MSFLHDDGRRLNIKMSDMMRGLTNTGGGVMNANNGTLTTPTTGTVGGKLSRFGATNYYRDYVVNQTATGTYQLYNNNHGLRGEGSPVADDAPVLYSFNKGRYRTSATGAPANITLPENAGNQSGSATVAVAMSKFTGISHCVLTTDPCGMTRGVKGGHTSGTATRTVGMETQQANSLGNLFSNEGGGLKTRTPGVNPNNGDFGISFYTTTHRNAWTELGLNTVCATGDLVIVIAHGGGGDMYQFTTTDPIYFRNESNNARSASITTHLQPHKNSTGTDDNLAIYTGQMTQDGATRVGVQPFHSSAQPYIFTVIVVKGPNARCSLDSSTSNTGATHNHTTKWTQPDSTPVEYSPSVPSVYDAATTQNFYIAVSSSPFYANSVANFQLGSFSSHSNKGWDMQARTSQTGVNGAAFVSICNYVGGGRATQTNDKFGYSYMTPIHGAYFPKYVKMIPAQDGRVIFLNGRRG